MMAVLTLPFAAHETGEEVGSQAVLGLHTEGVDRLVALVVALTLCATVICAKIIGCVLPIVAKVLKLDPAVMASPFITTIVDAVSLLVYFGIAKSLIPALA